MSTLDRLNLRPQEKRLVLGVGIFVFILLNYFTSGRASMT